MTRASPLAILILLAGTAVAQAQIGPPETRAPALGWAFGTGVHNVNSEWRPYDFVISRNRIYVEGAYGFTDYLEIFGRAGGADFVVNSVNTYEPEHTRDVSSDGYPAFLAGGLRFLGADFGRWSIGGSFETAVYSSQERAIRWDYDVYQELHFAPTVEMNLGLTLGRRIGERQMLYGGPLLHFAYTSVDVRTHEFGEDWEVEDEILAETVRDKAGLGAFLGWNAPLGPNGWVLQLEGSALRGGFGGALSMFCRI